MNPQLAKKAARMRVFATGDDVYTVVGDTATYTVHIAYGRAFCNCQGGRTGRTCSHKLAALHHHTTQKEKNV